jgi:CheY-like chemotaxis protein
MKRDDLPHQIRLALERLNDLGALMALDLTLDLAGEGQAPDLVARELRSVLLDAIESLNPRQNLPTRSRAARSYVLLYSRYVQEMTTEELLDLLAISLRQYRREHKKALDTITEIMVGRLQGRLVPARGPGLGATELSEAVQQETWALVQRAEVAPVDVGALLRETIALMRPVAEAHGVTLHDDVVVDDTARGADRPQLVNADRTIFRQILIGILSYALRQVRCGTVAVRAQARRGVTVEISAEPWFEPPAADPNWLVARQLVVSQKGRVDCAVTGQRWMASIHVPAVRDYSVLVIDDNQDSIEVFRRHVMGHPYTLHVAHDGAEAIRLVPEVQPDIITLDIMMSGLDGWETLQRLRALPESRTTPILICSVLNEPHLAAMLDATAMLPKPFTQGALLACLERLTRPGQARLVDR